MIDLILLGLFLYTVIGGLTTVIAMNEDRKLGANIMGAAEIVASFALWPVVLPMMTWYFWTTRKL